jgi:hypothetical protein
MLWYQYQTHRYTKSTSFSTNAIGVIILILIILSILVPIFGPGRIL